MNEDPTVQALRREVETLRTATRRSTVGMAAAFAISLGALATALWSHHAGLRPESHGNITIRDANGQKSLFLGLGEDGMPSLWLKETRSKGNGIQMGFRATGEPFFQLTDYAGIRLLVGASGGGNGRPAPFVRLFGDGGAEELTLSVTPRDWPSLRVGRPDGPHFELNLLSRAAMEAALRPENTCVVSGLQEKIRNAAGGVPSASPHMYLLGYNGEILWLVPELALDNQLDVSRQRRDEIRKWQR